MPCLRCSDCCHYVIYHYPNTKVVREWVKAREFVITQETKDILEVRAHHRCPHLTDKLCDIHEKKPLACKNYPEFDIEIYEKYGLNPVKSLMPGCGYRKEFERKFKEWKKSAG